MGRKTAISFTCSHCGAPLPLATPTVREGGVVKCARCGTDNFVSLPAEQRPVAQPAPHAPPLTPHVPPTVVVPPAVVVQTSTGGGGGGLGILVALLVLGGVGAGVYFFMQRTRSADSITSWAGSQRRICLADANGDGTKEVIGSGTLGSGQSLVAIDASSGKLVWNESIPSDDASRALLCGGGGVLALDTTGNKMSSIDPRTGKKSWTKNLSDNLESFAFGDACVALTTIDKVTATLEVATGKDTPCDKREAPSPLYGGQEGAVVGDARIELATSTGPGTPRLVVRATSKEKVLWESTFPQIKRDDAHVVAVPAGVVVAGTTRTSAEVTLVLLDAKTGATLRTRDVKVKDAGSFMSLAHADKTLFVESFGMLHTFAADTLEPGWWIGKFWVDE